MKITEEEWERLKRQAAERLTPKPPVVEPVAPSAVVRPPTYRSKWEVHYAARLDQAVNAGLVRQWWYEPFILRLPGGVRYRPDFMVQWPDGSLQVVEVKGWSRNLRDSLTRLKIAVALYPCFIWGIARYKRGVWIEERL
jgi:hypothetical protein